jgi:hypothetical protein
MMHRVEFEVTGATQAELEEAAERELARFASSGMTIDYSLEVAAGGRTVEGSVAIWRAAVHATVAHWREPLQQTAGGGQE